MEKKKLYKCAVCGHVVEGSIPDKCEVCGADGDAFVEVVEMEAPGPIGGLDRFLILGNGSAGFNAAKEIRKLLPEASITMVSKEKMKSYIRTNIGEYLDGSEPPEKFFLAKDSWYDENKIELLLGKTAVKLLPEDKKVVFDDGTEKSYDKLILANGSHNFIPPVQVEFDHSEKTPGFVLNDSNLKDAAGIHTLREFADTKELSGEIAPGKKAVVIGGGLLGLEAAWELKLLGVDVTVVEFVKRLLPRQLDNEGAAIFSGIANRSGLNLILGDSAQYIKIKKDPALTNKLGAKVAGVSLKSGGFIEADFVLFSVGIRSNLELAKEAGLAVERGVIVNRKMETSVPDIWACGDVCQLDGFVYGTWPAALGMGKTAGQNAAGIREDFKKFTNSTIFNSLNAKVFSAGSVDFDDPLLDQVGTRNDVEGTYRKVFFRDGKLVAGILIGDTTKQIKVLKAIENGLDYDSAKEAGLV
jgi:NAD(P)H-nitrite reductase large subunit